MEINTMNQSKLGFCGSYYKLYKAWEDAKTENIISKPIKEIIDEAKDVVCLSVSGKGRFHCITDKLDATFENTPVVFTDKEALHFKFLTEKTKTKVNEALNFIIRGSMEILSPDNKITRYKNFKALNPIIKDGGSIHISGASGCKYIINPDRPNVVCRKYVEPSQLPSEEAIKKLSDYIENPHPSISNFLNRIIESLAWE